MRLRSLLLCVLLLLGGWLWLSAQDSKEVSAPPTVSLKLLENRLAELQRSREQLVANIHAHDGAIEEVQRLISYLRQQEKPQKGEE